MTSGNVDKKTPQKAAAQSDAVRLSYPFREDAIRALRIGSTVSISGTIYTGRDRLHRYLADGGEAPVDLHDAAIFHCGPITVPDATSPSRFRIVAAGPTTSSRENPYMPSVIRKNGVRLILGKGGMGAETQAACRERGCAYVQVVGGAAAALAKCIKSVDTVWFLNEFGAAEAMWKLTVCDLPGIVAIDANGESLFSGIEQHSRERLLDVIGHPLVLDRNDAESAGDDFPETRDSAGSPPPMRVVFLGSADISSVVLETLHHAPGFEVCGVVTQPDRPAGRSRKLKACTAKETALNLGLEVISPEKVNAAEVREQIAAWRPDVIVVVAYGQFLGQKLLALPPLGCINVHLSLLPQYRGAAPIIRCIENGDEISGVTIMRLDQGMDSGDILSQASDPIREDDTAGTLRERLADMGANLLVKTLPKWRAGLVKPIKQNPAEVSFAKKIEKEDALINWTETANGIWLKVRAYNPWPACYSFFSYEKRGEKVVERLKVLSSKVLDDSFAPPTKPGTVAAITDNGPVISTGDGLLLLTGVQRAGGRPVSGADFLNGCKLEVGSSFDEDGE